MHNNYVDRSQTCPCYFEIRKFYVIFGQSFVKQFSLCYQTVVCLSVTLVYCGQTIRWIKMKLDMQVDLCARWGPSSPSPKRGHSLPRFSAHVYCGQTAKWIKMPLGMKGGHIVLDEDPSPPPPQKGTQPTNFQPISFVAKGLDRSRCHLVRR